MIRRARLPLLLGSLALFAQGALAQLNYAQRAVNIRAGVVVLDGQSGPGNVPANYDPYVWYSLDSDTRVKPAGWNFYNAASAGQVTPQIFARWSAINTTIGAGFNPVLTDRLSKKNAAYWEVFLSQTSDDQLAQYDVLEVSIRSATNVNPLERGLLRRFVESGGVLWVDISSTGSIDPINGLPMPFMINNSSVLPGPDADWLHPLLNSPNVISPNALAAMQGDFPNLFGLRLVDLNALGFGDIVRMQQPTNLADGDYGRFYHVAVDAHGPFISVARIGDGYMVVTTRGMAYSLNRTQQTANDGLPNGAYVVNRASTSVTLVPDATTDAAAKLAINMVNLISGHSQFGKGSHKTGSGPIDITAPLLRRFSDTTNVPTPTGPTDAVPPAIFKGLIVATVGDRVMVYDANPSRDLDQDGNPDDGFPDYSLGDTKDLVWRSAPLPTPISSPSCAEVPNSAIPNQVSVVDGSGRLVIFNAYQSTYDNVAPGFTAGPPTNYTAPPAGNQRGPFSPTFYDGYYFVADAATTTSSTTVGRVWIADARDGTVKQTTAPWAVGGGNVSQMQVPSSSPTVGDIPIQDGSGGTDRVVYIPTKPNVSAGPQTKAGFTSLWFGVKGEKPNNVMESGGVVQVFTRAALQGLDIYTANGSDSDPLGIRLTVIDGGGNPLSAAAMNQIFQGQPSQANGVISFLEKSGQTLPANATLRIDYTIDWGTGNASIQNQIIRGNIFLPDQGGTAIPTRQILQRIVLSRTGMLYMVAATPGAPNLDNDGGTYYAFKEVGRGNFQLLDRYDLYQAHTVTLNQAAPVSYSETLFDTDEIQSLMPAFLTGPMQHLRFRGAPVVANGLVYVTAVGYKFNGWVPCSIVMAFAADPPAAEIEVPAINGAFTLLQPDFARESLNKLKPTTFSILQPGQYTYDANNRGGTGRIRIPLLSPNQRGLIANSFSRSQPVIIRRNGQPDILVEPDRSASHWGTLQWYCVYNGYETHAPVSVTGNTLFMAANSRIVSFLKGDPIPFFPQGLLVGMDADVSPTDSFLHANPVRPWLKQLWQLDVVNPTTINVNPDIRWPQTRGVTSFDEWRQRLLQSSIPAADAYGVVAGDGVLATWGPPSTNPAPPLSGGLFGFSRADLMIADESRLVRFDSNGNPLWSSDASSSTGTQLNSGAAGDFKPLVRPTRAYSMSNNDIMVVDTGGDRVVELDTAGRETRSITGFHLDPSYTPEGFKANETLNLRQPRDVVVYASYEANPANYTPHKTLEYWVHFLIADTGNKRLVEVIDRYEADPATRRIIGPIVDSNNVTAIGVLNWHNPENFTSKNYQYTALTSIYDGISVPGTPFRRFAVSMGSSLPTRTGVGLDTPSALPTRSSEDGNGGIIVFNPVTGVEDVIDQILVPDIAANVFWNAGAGAFLSDAIPAHLKKLSNVRSVSMRFEDGGRLCILFADNDGVYEVYKDSGNWVVRWMLPKAAYLAMRRNTLSNVPTALNPLDLLPTYARRLDSGSVLIANGYYGQLGNGSEFKGEVFEVDGSLDASNTNGTLGYGTGKLNLGFNWYSLLFQLPPVSGARGIVIPVFADRR